MPLSGQTSAGVSLTGKVEGTGGAALAGMKVTLVRQDTQEKEDATTAQDGSFAFAGLVQDNYVLSIDAAGFEPYSQAVQIGDEAPSPLEIKLKLRTIAAKVTVKAYTNNERLSPDSNTDSLDLNENFFNDLPLEIDYLQSYIATFLSPAQESNQGASIVVDGVDGGDLDMPTSAIKKLKINRNPYSVEFQYPGAARAEIKTKHGHHERYDGSVAFFARNSVFDARNPMADTNPSLNRRFVEANLGGPLPGREGSFFLAGQRLMDDESAVVNSLDTVALTGPLNLNVPNPRRKDHLFARAQWTLTQSQWLSVNYAFTDKSTTNNNVGGLTLPEQGFSNGRHTHRAQIVYSQAVSPQLFNRAILIFRDEVNRSGNPATGPQIVVSGAFTGGPNQTFAGSERHGLVLQDTATYTRGRQNIVFGGTIWNDWWNVFDAANFGGTFEFGSLQEYINVVQNHSGTPDLFQENQGIPTVSFLSQQSSGFVQDTILAQPNLSLTFGLRYDWQNTLDDRKDLAPRFQLAFTPGKQRRTVLRAGAGIFYDNLPRLATQSSLLFNGVQVHEIDITNPSYPDPFQGGQVTAPPPSITRVSPAARSPYMIQGSVGIEEEVTKTSWLSLDYSLSHGVHLFRLRDVNAPLSSANGARPNPNFSNIEEYEPTAFLRGYALTVAFRGTLGKYFKGYAQYVFSKYANDVSSAWPGLYVFPADNYNLQPETGPADFDLRHRVNLSGVLQLPLGLRIGSIFSAASGAPFDITTGSDPNGDTLTRPPGVTRNTGRGPATVELDTRLTKVFSLEHGQERELPPRRRMELSLDAFNVLNHPNVTSIVGVAGSPLFGQPASIGPARTLQMSIKFAF